MEDRRRRSNVGLVMRYWFLRRKIDSNTEKSFLVLSTHPFEVFLYIASLSSSATYAYVTISSADRRSRLRHLYGKKRALSKSSRDEETQLVQEIG